MKKMNYAVEVFFKSKIYSGANTLLSENSHFPSDPSCNQPSVRALWALLGVKGPDQPHLGPPQPLPMGQELHFSSAVGIGLQLCPCPAWPWALLSWGLIHCLILWHDLRPALSLWTCAAIVGLCLNLITFTRPGPDLLIDFLA